MKKLFPILLIVLFTYTSFAQNQCNDYSLVKIKGKWPEKTVCNADKTKSPEVLARLDKSDFKNFRANDKRRMLVIVNESYFSTKLPGFVPKISLCTGCGKESSQV